MPNLKKTLLIFLCGVFVLLPNLAEAMELVKYSKNVVDVFNDASMTLLSFVGKLVLFILMFGGVYYIMSGADPQKQETAKKIISRCLFGLIFILISYALLKNVSTIVTGDIIYISSASVVPISGPPGTIFTIKATITASAGVDAATTIAHIQSPDETDVDTVLLVDDGTSGDAVAGDNIYTGTWTTGVIGPYFVDITACDIAGNCAEANNI